MMLSSYYKGKKQDIPEHIANIPLFLKYMWSDFAFLMAGIRVALKQGIIKQAYDYDDDSDSGRRFPYAMVCVMDR